MGPLGGPEMILIFIVILLLFGAKKLPELARGMGKSLGEFKKAKDEFEHEIMNADQDAYSGKSENKEAPKKEEEIAPAASTQPYDEAEIPAAEKPAAEVPAEEHKA